MAYRVTCDGFPLLDPRHEDYILVSPCVNLEVNTVGEGSFTIYKTHPHYDTLKKLKSVFEVSDENGVIFRGRATGDTIDFDHGMAVDLEGAMAYFNDSVVRPFSFPEDFLEDADYITAAESGNVIAFFLGWLIDNHNAQVEDFQKMKLGNVTVVDPNNYITRSSSDYASTWAMLKGKLFDSSLGGYLCIRYEPDGNYIDYLAEFTETNSQEIAFGENILDLTRATEASGTYSAIIPIGAAGLTIEGKADGDITEDLVKSGDTIYSRNAVAEYGWIYAPTSETTWEDVTGDDNLLKKGGEWLANGGVLFSNGIEVTAVDLHFSDAQIESLRIYKNAIARSRPHGLSESFPLTRLEIELLEPQNTKITIGKTVVPLTERTIIQEEEARKKYSKLSKTDDEIRMEVVDLLNGAEARWTASVDGFSQTVQGYTKAVEGYDQAVEQYGKQVSSFDQTVGGFKLTVEGYKTAVEGYEDAVGEYATQVSTFEQTAKGFSLSVEDLDKKVSNSLTLDANGLIVTGSGGSVTINGGQIDATGLNVDAANITGTLKANQIDATGLKLTGQLTWEDFSDTGKVTVLEETTTAATENVQTNVLPDYSDRIQASQERADSAYELAQEAGNVAGDAQDTADGAVKKLDAWTYKGTTKMDGAMLQTGTVRASTLEGGEVKILASNDSEVGSMKMQQTASVGLTLQSEYTLRLIAAGNVYINNSANGNTIQLTQSSYTNAIAFTCDQIIGSGSGSDLGASGRKWQDIYLLNEPWSTSDRNEKNSIENLPEKYLTVFDNLVPKRFKLNDGTSDRYHVGFIAQDVEDAMVLAGVASQEFGGFGKGYDPENKRDVYMLRYGEFIAILAAKLQDVDKRVKSLEGTA